MFMCGKKLLQIYELSALPFFNFEIRDLEFATYIVVQDGLSLVCKPHRLSQLYIHDDALATSVFVIVTKQYGAFA